MPIGDIATFAISGKGLAYSYPSPMDHTPRRDWNETSPPKAISASGRGRCRAAGRVARRWAQAYPSRPVRWIVGFAAGGTTDIVARLIGQWLSERLGQPFIIENRPGAGTNIATEAVVRAPADGYTLLFVGAANAINATLYDKLNFNFIRDIAPVAGIVRVPNVMVVNPSVPAKTVPEFIAYAKANPGKINMASSGDRDVAPSGRRAVQDDGRRQHAARALSRRGARADRPARRTGAGHVRHHACFDRVHQGRQAARAGGDHRDALGGAAGYSDRRRVRAGLRGERWFGVGAPKNTPAEIIDKLNKEINAGLADPKIKARLADLGGTVLRARPPTSASSSPTKPRSGAR